MERVVIAGVVALAIAACSGSGAVPSPLASSPASPRASMAAYATIDVLSSVAPSATGTATEPLSGPLAPMSLAVVNVAELNVRVAPTTSAKLLEAMFLKVPLPKGSRVLILDGPVAADGYTWYLAGLTSEVGTPVGWVSSGRPGDSWLSPDRTPCPAADMRTIPALSGIQRYGCFGSQSLVLVARQMTAPEDVGFGGACGPTEGRPAWLVCERYDWVNADGDPDASLLLYFDPAVGIKPTGLAQPGTVGPLWAVRGHFGDPAAAACGNGLGPLDARAASLQCSTLFVVEALALSN